MLTINKVQCSDTNYKTFSTQWNNVPKIYNVKFVNKMQPTGI